MAVVSLKSTLIPDFATDYHGADPELARGRPVMSVGTATNGATDSATSKYHLITLPSFVILQERTQFDVQNWGFATVNIGTIDDTTALMTVLKSAGNTASPIAFGDANHGLPLWQVLGLAADPGGTIDLYAHGPAGATGAGSMPFRFEYLTR